MDLVQRFERVISRIEARMDRSDRLLDELSKFSRRALDEIYRMSETPVPLSRNADMAAQDDCQEVEKEFLMFKGQNLYDLGGATFVEMAFNIVKVLWDDEERRTLCIEPKKTLSGINGRKAADTERTALYQKAVKFCFGDQYTDKLYRNTLRLVNQRLREKRLSGAL